VPTAPVREGAVLACDGAVPARTGFVLVCAAVALPVLLQAAAISAATVSGTAEHQRAMLVPVFFIDPSPLGLGGPARQPLPIDYRPGHIRSEPTVYRPFLFQTEHSARPIRA
jgi:hypothetical protein